MAFGLGNRCSILLSYRGKFFVHHQLRIFLITAFFYYDNLDDNRQAGYSIIALIIDHPGCRKVVAHG